MSIINLQKLAQPVPRYTSYPTAPHFHAGIDNGSYRDWLAAITPEQSLSLYFHIPFCDTLCWFCGCATKHVQRYQPVRDYLPFLKREITTISEMVDSGAGVKTIHWGGGSPTILTPDDITALAQHTAQHFTLRDDVDFSVEIDPRGVDEEKVNCLAKAGVTRASIGVQDFNPKVQAAINRVQSYEETRKVIDSLRNAGINRINIDLIYGLPHQTEATMRDTIAQVVTLQPDRLAVFGYAHVPWMKRHQTMIDDESLPGLEARFQQSQLMATLLCDAGFEAIGMDHFAQPSDRLCAARNDGILRRNFQGYTDDPADILLGFGASAIGKLPQGYIHNATPTKQYKELVDAHGMAAISGYAFQPDDLLRAHVIEQLICNYEFSGPDLINQFGVHAEAILTIAQDYAAGDGQDLTEWRDRVFRIKPQGRPFVRHICAQFDSFLASGTARHSIAV